TVWTIVNRNEYDLDGAQMTLTHRDGMRYFDLYHGVELKPSAEGNQDTLHFALEAHGYAAIFASSSEPDAHMKELMSKMATMTAKPLADYPHQWTAIPQKIVDIAATSPANSTPEGMLQIPGGSFNFEVEG